MKELYCLGFFVEGKFAYFIRKSRNNNIVAYEDEAHAKRGLAQSRRKVDDPERYQIIRFSDGKVVDLND